jgi:Protein of unknown function (DUF3237)
MTQQALDVAVELKLDHAFDIRIDFLDRDIFGPVAGNLRQGYTPVKSGIVQGPRLNGRLVPHGGADWPLVRPDGVVELNAHYMIEADDGALIYIRNFGYVYGARPAGQGTDRAPRAAYFRCTPYFRAPEGPHGWLNCTVIVGGGERHTDPDHTLFRYYAVS